MAKDERIRQLWVDGIKQYEEKTKRKLESDDKFRTIKSLKDLECAVDEDGDQFKAYEGKHQKAFSTFAKCIKPLQVALGIVEKGIGSTPYGPACVVFGVASHLLEACKGVGKSYEAVEALFDQVLNFTSRLQDYVKGNIEAGLEVKIIKVLAYILEIFGAAERLIKEKRIKKWARLAFFGEDDIHSCVSRLQDFFRDELDVVVVLVYSRLRELQQTTEEGFGKAERRAEDKWLSEVLRTPSTAKALRKHAENIKGLAPDTGNWLKDDQKFDDWEQGKFPILWVFGHPGVGKTMLATQTVNILREKYSPRPDIPSRTSVSYFYFRYDEPHLQRCDQLWTAVTSQITAVNERFRKHVYENIWEYGEGLFSSATSNWKEVFLDFFTADLSAQSPPSLAIIVIDGLDEAQEQEKDSVLNCLAELVRQNTDNQRCWIQVAVFARHELKARYSFEEIPTKAEAIVEVTSDRNLKDIERFIKHALGKVRVLRELRRVSGSNVRAFAKEVSTEIRNRSKGMFLWARLAIDEILELDSPEEIRMSLTHAPEGLDEMFHQVFKRLDDGQGKSSTFRTLLTWVLYANKPLSIAELYVMLVITEEKQYVLIEKDLRYRYASLLAVKNSAGDGSGRSEHDIWEGSDRQELDEFDNIFDDDDPGRPFSDTSTLIINLDDRWYQSFVTFAHERVRDYLITEINPLKRRWNDCPSIIPNDPNVSKLLIALACVRLLSTNKLERYTAPSLREYVKVNWVKHFHDVDFREVEKIEQPLVGEAAKALAKLFYNGFDLLASTRGVRDEFLKTWFKTNTCSTHIRTIISNHVHGLEDEQREWALGIKDSALSFFRPLITACAKTWLEKSDWADEAYLDNFEHEVWILFAYSKLADDGSYYGPSSLFEATKEIWNIPPESIEALAELVPLVKTEHFYTGLGWVLAEANKLPYSKRAVDHFEKALDLSPVGWMAMAGLAVCYSNLKKYERADSLMRNAISNIPQIQNHHRYDLRLRTRMGTWQRHLNKNQWLEDSQIAYRHSRDLKYPTNSADDHFILLAVKNYIDALNETKQHAELISLLYDLDLEDTGDKDQTLWITFIRAQFNNAYNVGLFDMVSLISRDLWREDFIDFMKLSFAKAANLNAETILETQTRWLAGEGAKWLYHHADVPEESTELWAKTFELIGKSDEALQDSSSRYREAAAHLGMMCFNSALKAREEGKGPSPHLQRLEELARHGEDFRALYPAMALGMWRHDFENADEEMWMQCLRPSVKRSLSLLDDGDPLNDRYGYFQLGHALLMANDVTNGRIAMAISSFEMVEHEDESEESDEEYLESLDVLVRAHLVRAHASNWTDLKQTWSCSGPCNSDATNYRQFYSCRFCDDQGFCQDCMTLVNTDQAPFTRCSREHDFTQVYPFTEETSRMIKAFGITETFNIEATQEWLNGLKVIWKLGD